MIPLRGGTEVVRGHPQLGFSEGCGDHADGCPASWAWALSLTRTGWQAARQVVLCGTFRESQPRSHAPVPGGPRPQDLCPGELAVRSARRGSTSIIRFLTKRKCAGEGSAVAGGNESWGLGGTAPGGRQESHLMPLGAASRGLPKTAAEMQGRSYPRQNHAG